MEHKNQVKEDVKEVIDVESKRSSTLDSLAIAGIVAITLAIFSGPLQQAWKTSGDVCDSAWNILLDYVGDDELTLAVWGTFVISLVVYWVVGSFFIFLDLTNVLSKYKVQPGWNEPVEKDKLFKAIIVVLFNQIAVTLPCLYLHYHVMAWRGTPPTRELPSLFTVLFSSGVYLLVEEFGFYYSHRLLHHRFFYRHIHKIHHEWTAPIAIVAIYCHPLEHLVSNMLPPLIATTMLGSHVIMSYIVTTAFTFNTLCVHSGYHLPFFPSPQSHDFHHLKFTQNYGTLGILDRYHGTNNLFLSSGVSKRHRVLRGFTPIEEVVPLKKQF